MSEIRQCAQCGAELPVDAPQGICPECALKMGLDSQPDLPRSGQDETSVQDEWYGPPEPEELAKQFPQVDILELLGQGGMGVVYKARQRNLDRLVALKIMAPKFGRDPMFAERFAREARSLAKLNHPHIVTIYEFGQADRLYYFMMEYVDGINLRQSLKASRLSPNEALAIVPQICDALQYAHDEGIVHRDIKPENVLLDKKGRVKIADFGLAKLLGRSAGDVQLTVAQQVMGTPHYMAPEQLETPLHVDHRADIYSLGVLFYELLTGELPLGRFDPPSYKVQVDVALDSVVLRTLEKDPERRYQHASELKTDIESLPKDAHAGPSSVAAPANPPSEFDIEAARQAVKGPALGLLIVGIVDLLPVVFLLIVGFAYFLRGIPSPNPELTLIHPSAFSFGNAVLAQQTWNTDLGFVTTFRGVSLAVLPLAATLILSLPIAGVLILGGWKMSKADLYALAVLASVLALLPCHAGFVIGLPIGIWSLMVLTRPGVKAAFALKAGG